MFQFAMLVYQRVTDRTLVKGRPFFVSHNLCGFFAQFSLFCVVFFLAGLTICGPRFERETTSLRLKQFENIIGLLMILIWLLIQ